MQLSLIPLYPANTIKNIVYYCPIKVTFDVPVIRWKGIGNKRKEKILKQIIRLGLVLNFATDNCIYEIPIFIERLSRCFYILRLFISICS